MLARRLIPGSPRCSRGRLTEADEVVREITGLDSERGYLDTRPDGSGQSPVAELWSRHRGRLEFGMALDFSEAAGYYGLYTAMSIFVFSSSTGAVPIGDATLPLYFLIANIGALLGRIVVSVGLDRFGRRPTVHLSYLAPAGSMLAVAAAATTGSPVAVLVAFAIAAFFATCAWVSAYPTFSELVPTHLRATGVGVSVGVGRSGAVIGQVLLAGAATALSLTSMFVLLGALWLIGAVAGALWWRYGVEARGQNLEVLATVSAQPAK